MNEGSLAMYQGLKTIYNLVFLLMLKGEGNIPQGACSPQEIKLIMCLDVTQEGDKSTA